MKYDFVGLMCRGAKALEKSDGGAAFALYELAGNLQRVIRGEASIDDFKAVYTGEDGELVDADVKMPLDA